MSDSVTPPRPTAPTAAELRDRFVRKLEVHLASLSAAADAREDLDRLVAAVRAEALEAVTDAIEAASRSNSAQTQAAQDAGEDEKARMLILWGGGIVEALATARAMVSK